jgi:hypothetical protein
MALKGNLSTLKGLKQKIAAFPTSLRHAVAQEAAPAMTDLTQQSYGSGETVYGERRPASIVTGQALDLDATGATKRGLKFKADGSLIRCSLPEPYTKYLIGKYEILPNGRLPLRWTSALADITEKQKPDLK